MSMSHEHLPVLVVRSSVKVILVSRQMTGSSFRPLLGMSALNQVADEVKSIAGIDLYPASTIYEAL